MTESLPVFLILLQNDSLTDSEAAPKDMTAVNAVRLNPQVLLNVRQHLQKKSEAYF